MNPKLLTVPKSKVLRYKIVSLLYLLFLTLTFVYAPNRFLHAYREVTRNSELYYNDIQTISSNIEHISLFTDSVLNRIKPEALTKIRLLNHLADSTCNFLKKVSEETILLIHSPNLDSLDYSQLSNYSVTNSLVKNGTASEMKYLLSGYADFVKRIGVDTILIKKNLAVKNWITDYSGTDRTWENYFFKRKPVIIFLAGIRQFEIQVRQLQFEGISTITGISLPKLMHEYYRFYLNLPASKVKKTIARNSVNNPEKLKVNILLQEYESRPLFPIGKEVRFNVEGNNLNVRRQHDTLYLFAGKSGVGNLKITVNQPGKPIETINIQAKIFTSEVAECYPDESGNSKEVSAEVFKFNRKLESTSSNRIVNFKLIRIDGNTKALTEITNSGNQFCKAVLAAIKMAEPGDIYLFTSISEINQSGNIVPDQPLQIQIR